MARRYYLPDQKIWSCRMKLPDSNLSSRVSSPVDPSRNMASTTDLEESSNDARQPIEQAMSMAAKLQNRMEDDMETHQDPDAQATVTDFLDFTEYLPSDMTRSLTLIGNLDETYTKASKNVHELTKAYGELPIRPASERPDPVELRADISRNLSEAVTARTLSYEEACRLKENVDRHYNRLKNIHAKLQKMAENYPPSRAASPEPQQSKSPQATRAAPKVTLRLDGSKAGERVRKPRSPRITVPGEVMAPFEVDYDSYGSYSDLELSGEEDGLSQTQTPGPVTNKPKSIKLNVVPKIPKEKVPKPSRPPRPDGTMGTNVHSQVAGISTSNALAKLKPPASDAKPGDSDAPWLKLTAWELAKLRKKMKKNAVWNPSDTMIARELKTKGRSLDDYKKHNIERQAAGLSPLDIFPQMMNAAQATRVLEEGEISAEAWKKGELSNRGMKLNEAKKLKKEIEKKAAIEVGKTSNANELSTVQGVAAMKDGPTSKDTLADVNSVKDTTSKVVPGEVIVAKDTPAKPATSKTPAPKKSHKKAPPKEVKDPKNGIKEDAPSETPTEHTHLLSNLEGIKERIKNVTSGLPVSTADKAAENQGATPKKQSAKTSKKRKTRDSTADTETSKASKASKIEGPGGSSLRIERSATETPVPNPPPPPSSTATSTSIPLAPPGPASSRSNPRRGTPANAVTTVIEPAVYADQNSISLAPVDTVPATTAAKETADSAIQSVVEPEVKILQEVVAQETVAGLAQELEPAVGKEIVKEPPKKKETQKERRARQKLEKEAKKEAQIAIQAAAQAAAPIEAPEEAPKPATAVTASATRNRRKASIATVVPLPEIPIAPRRAPSRPASRNGKAPSHEPQPSAAKERPRRSSTAHNTPAPEPRAPSKRLEAKRPPPGQVTAGPEGSASVSVSTRKAAPRKRVAPKKHKEEGKEPVVEDMVEFDDEGNIIDESEPRYCTCNKVSFGNMIACDSEKILGRDCPFGEWFHYECVGYSETNMPPRRDSWYCKDCLQEINALKSQNEKGNKRK